jgi:regulator of sigma E protease
MLTLIAFLVAIALLVAVHELGHFAIARACGVQVLRFSIGFGPRLIGWTSSKSGTEYIIGWVPLGGYVKMLDEHETAVPQKDRQRAFNTQPLYSRAAIVIAGPLANLMLAVILHTSVNWTGVQQPLAILAKPAQESVLAAAGLKGGERIERAGFEGDALEEIASYEEFRWLITRGAIEHRDVQLEYSVMPSQSLRLTTLEMAHVDTSQVNAEMLQRLGITGPHSQAQIGNLIPGSAAERAGLQPGDVVIKVDETYIVDAVQLRDLIRASGHAGQPQPQTWQIQRKDSQRTVSVTPQPVIEGERKIGRIGAIVGAPPTMTMVRYGAFDGIGRAATQTWETSMLTLRVIGQIVTGEASVKNLSGPIAIADYAGKSAAIGLTPFILFLALMSISLGVLNLLPLPILDGGHLMYYLWEALSGKPLAQRWIDQLQKLGLVILLLMMSVALINDVTRFLP